MLQILLTRDINNHSRTMIIKIAIILIFMRTLVVTVDTCVWKRDSLLLLFFICHAIKINKCLWLSQKKKREEEDKSRHKKSLVYVCTSCHVKQIKANQSSDVDEWPPIDKNSFGFLFLWQAPAVHHVCARLLFSVRRKKES